MFSKKNFIAALLCASTADAFSVYTTFTGGIHQTIKFGRSATDSTTQLRMVDEHSNRREYVSSQLKFLAALSTTSIVTNTVTIAPSNAFDNKISNQYDDKPKNHGPQPKDLNIGTRKDMIGKEYQGLKSCGPAPNCFCSTDDAEDDLDHSIPSWIWPSNLDQQQAFSQLEETISLYQPGQGNIDGGGFKIITSDAKKGYIYVQFESLKNGYIDDVEFAVVKGLGDNAVQVRSSSRIGYLDFGVNAKRLNYIAKMVTEKGWKASGVEYATHKGYYIENQVSP